MPGRRSSRETIANTSRRESDTTRRRALKQTRETRVRKKEREKREERTNEMTTLAEESHVDGLLVKRVSFLALVKSVLGVAGARKKRIDFHRRKNLLDRFTRQLQEKDRSAVNVRIHQSVIEGIQTRERKLTERKIVQEIEVGEKVIFVRGIEYCGARRRRRRRRRRESQIGLTVLFTRLFSPTRRK